MPQSITLNPLLARIYAIVPPPPSSTFPSSLIWNLTLLSSKSLRSLATYSALASLAPDLPLAPVYLFNPTPLPKNDAFLFSATEAYIGSKAPSTSAESISEFAKHLPIIFGVLSSPVKASSSPTKVSKARDSIPVFPTLPISSLSTSMQIAVFLGCSTSNIALRLVYAQTLSSCPYPATILLSKPKDLALKPGITSSSALKKSFSTIPYFSFNIFKILSLTFSETFSSS